MIDIKTRFANLKDPERLRAGIDEFLEKVFYTDAILVYSPSQISLAAIIHSASSIKENVDEYITRTLFVDDAQFLLSLVEAVKSKTHTDTDTDRLLLVVRLNVPLLS